MSVSKYLTESINTSIKEPMHIMPRGFKPWIPLVKKVLKKVPIDAIPDIVGAFSHVNVLHDRKLVTPRVYKTKNALSMIAYELKIPIASASEIDLINKRKFSQYKNDDDGWERYLEIAKNININSSDYKRSNFKCVYINTKKFKSPNDMSLYKTKVNKTYFDKHGKYWWVNETAEETICHELGHIFDNNRNISSKSEWSSLAEKWVRDDNAPEYCTASTSDGWLSGGSYSEAFAEAFSNVIISNGDNVPTYIRDYIKNII